MALIVLNEGAEVENFNITFDVNLVATHYHLISVATTPLKIKLMKKYSFISL